MPGITIAELSQHVGQTVTLSGWLYNSRSAGKLIFLILRDGTGLCQCVVEKSDAGVGLFSTAAGLHQEASLRVTGTVRADERSVGGFELAAVSAIDVIQNAEGFPITPKPHGIDFLMKQRHLWFRSRRQWTILRIRATLVDAIRRFFNDRGFVCIDTPIFAPSAGEGAQTLFKVDYFGDEVYLAQTGQLYLEAACMSHRNVYCFGPTFRAEKSKTRRHLTEFWMVEPEIAYADLDDDIALAQDFVHEIAMRVIRDHRSDLEFLGRDVGTLERQVQLPFYRMTYTEASEILRGPRARELLERERADATARIAALKDEIAGKEAARGAPGVKKFKADQLLHEIAQAREQLTDLEEHVRNIPQHMALAANFEWGGDLGGSDETIIAKLHDRPVFVTHYPKTCKAFYMKRNGQDPRVVNNFDLLAPEGYGEIIGGSQREDDYDVLMEKLREEGLDPAPYEWYLDLRRYGSVPHAGFGLGVERTLVWLCGLTHVREAIPFARTMGRLWP